ncbi:peptidoglycan-binding domain-containing protein [Rhizobium sp. SL86]|uniref:peptidoglycan-binding domain-containing protein n=1 Tax=Rhizobium sp. SL86 TaxID=2995148 RepID=UPI0022767D32|nr:peptidoglycan-binding protein [Rhizobium sp. SL86]MCY1664209.1 peptidoglycan-binding protein [Rhizobium sp. SL86]
MTARKRKAPDRRKKPVKEPGLLVSLLSAAGRQAARNPRGVGTSLAMAIAFSFVVANALWYQPGGHPHPFLRTRDPEDPNAIAGYRPALREPSRDVTTFHIERQSETPLVPPEAARRPQAPIELPESTAATSGGAPAYADPLLIKTPQPAEQAAAVEQALPIAPVVPTQRPAGNLAAEDPVAAAIRAAERKPVAPQSASAAPKPAPKTGAGLKPPAEIPHNEAENAEAQPAHASRADQAAARPTNAAVQPNATPDLADVNLVMQIQRGLANIAYTDVKVDGVAGAQTRAAIRHFQKHYRLAENGEPSEAVLKKLKSIGAL